MDDKKTTEQARSTFHDYNFVTEIQKTGALRVLRMLNSNTPKFNT